MAKQKDVGLAKTFDEERKNLIKIGMKNLSWGKRLDKKNEDLKAENKALKLLCEGKELSKDELKADNKYLKERNDELKVENEKLRKSRDKPRNAVLSQLFTYVENRDREGWYYGNREQFENRHQEIKDWLLSLME